jgi:hypothetical protein
MTTVVASLLPALLSLAIRHVRVRYWLTDPRLRSRGLGSARSEPVRGLVDRVVTILTVRSEYG